MRIPRAGQMYAYRRFLHGIDKNDKPAGDII